MSLSGSPYTLRAAGRALLLAAIAATVARGDLPCAQCHPKETAGFAATAMGRSAGPPARVRAGSFVQAASQTRFSVDYSGSRMVQHIARGGLSAQHDIAFQVGSGTHAFGYLIDLGNHLFQSPLGYFAGRGWAMSPGYETSKAPDFYRPVTPECLFCHSGRALPVAGSLNTYRDPPFEAEAITCERCHGPAEAHLRAPLPGTIVNPAKLPPRARDSVCEQCHLNGEERVPNPGKQLADFHPGENLEDVFSVYVYASSVDPEHPDPLRVVGQVQRLALSRCARESGGKLWCGTCHDPHVQPADSKAYFRARCLGCHGDALLKTHSKPDLDCAGCHMPRRPVTDGAHTIFTDHRIAIYSPRELASPPERPAPAGTAGQPPPALVAWREPAGELAKRNLGLAEVLVGDRTESFPLVSRGFDALRECADTFPNDPAVLTAIGKALLAGGRPSEAAVAFELAAQLEPAVAVRYLNLGLAYHAVPDFTKAVENLDKARQLDPLLEQPYLELAVIYSAEHDQAALRSVEESYLKAFPGDLKAQMALRTGGAMVTTGRGRGDR